MFCFSGKISKVKNVADATEPLLEVMDGENDQTNYHNILTQLRKAYEEMDGYYNEFRINADSQVVVV